MSCFFKHSKPKDRLILNSEGTVFCHHDSNIQGCNCNASLRTYDFYSFFPLPFSSASQNDYWCVSRKKLTPTRCHSACYSSHTSKHRVPKTKTKEKEKKKDQKKESGQPFSRAENRLRVKVKW